MLLVGPNHGETMGHPHVAQAGVADNAVKYGTAAHIVLESDPKALRVTWGDGGWSRQGHYQLLS